MRNKTLQKGLLILEALAAEAREFSLAEVASMVALDKSQTCRLLQTLAAMDYVIRDPRTRKYRIGLRTLELSSSILSRMELYRTGIPYLRDLSDRVHATSYLGVLHQGRVLVIATVYPAGVYRDNAPGFGSVMALRNCAMGKVLLAHMSPEEAGEIGAEFKKQLERIRAEDVAVIIKGANLTESVVGVAAPVRNYEGQVIAALGASLGLSAWQEHDQGDFREAVKTAAAGLSFGLGHAASRIAL
jgi:DNA-binding IclR family transcriptional regulator